MIIKPMWVIRHIPTDGYLPIGMGSRQVSTLTNQEPHIEGWKVPRVFPSIASVQAAKSRYIEGVWQNYYEDGLQTSNPKSGVRKKQDYEAVQIIVTEALMGKPMIFVFGSNEAGIHGAGAAKDALKSYGAVLGKGHGHYGQSYALPTKSPGLRTLNYNEIHKYVDTFIAYAKEHPEWSFKVTRIGCGLAGLSDEKIAALFKDAPENCLFDNAWKPFLKPETQFWGTYG